MRTVIRYTILNQDGQPVIRAVRVVYPSTARVAPLPQTVAAEQPAVTAEGRDGESIRVAERRERSGE
ncbi:MAG: hypothetical protein RMK01_04705 [Thermomicrobium sp.]|nr:hypothetical protein [Thermomicrobium sp.]